MSKLDFILADTTHLAMLKALDRVMEESQTDLFGNFVVIVPDGKTIMAEKYLLSVCPSGAFSNIYIYTLKRLLNKISPQNNKLVLSKTAGTMIVRKIILSNLEKLVCFRKTANTNGFAETIFGTISQLKSSGVSVADFYNMAEGVKPSLKIKMQDIALLYDEYQQYIENNYIDQSDLYNILEQTASQSNFIKQSQIYLCGFESITSEALSVCKELINNAKSVVVAASYMSGGNNSHIADNEVFNKFKTIADSKNYQYMPARYTHKFNKDFLHIKNNLYAYPAKVKNGTNSLEILSASNIQGEVDFVSQKISGLIKSGVKYNNIAVVVNGLEIYQQKINDIFSAYGFSYFISTPYDYSLHPLFKLIKSYLQIVRKNYDVSACIEFLSNGLINNSNYLDDFINYVNQYGINHRKFTQPFTVYDEKVLSAEQFAGVENLRKALVNLVEIFKVEKSTAGEFLSAIKNLLNHINIEERLNLLADSQAEDRIYYNITLQAKNKLDSTLEQIQTFLSNEQMSLEMFESILLSGLSVADVSLVPVSQDAIVVGPNADGLLNIDYLFVLNATEGNFPLKQQDCGIIIDSEINELNQKISKTIEPTIKTINRRERFKAYETLLLPTTKVYLSFSSSSADGAQKESNIIEQFINMFGGKDQLSVQKYENEFNINPTTIEADVKSQICSPNKAIKYVCAEIGNKRAYGNFNNIKLVNAVYAESKKYMPENLKSALEKINIGKDYNLLCSKDLFFTKQTTSTSQLEKFFTCPFLFFTNYGLRLKENFSSKLKALDVGNILHKVAEVFVKKICKNPELNVLSTAKAIVGNIISTEYVAEDNKFLLKIVEEEAVRLCERLQKELVHSHFKPIGIEESFGKGKKYSGVSLAGGKISLEGKIDRIDIHQDRFRIIDYKTGKIEDNIKRVFYGKKIQLVTYLLAMQNSGLKPAGVVYFPIRNEFSQEGKLSGKMKGFFVNDSNIIMQMDTTLNADKRESDFIDIKLNKPKNGEFALKNSANLLTDAQFKDLSNYVTQLCDKAINEILSGYIEPSPIRLSSSDRLPCENCSFAGVCGVDKTRYAFGRKCYSDVKIDSISNIGGDIDGK